MRGFLVVMQLWVIVAAVFFTASSQAAQCEETSRPNILWITCEDMGPHLGCYGDTYANTPNLDQLISEERRVGKECRSRWSPYH